MENRYLKLISIISTCSIILGLSFIGGVYVGKYETFPFGYLKRVQDGYQAYKKKLALKKKKITGDKKYQRFPYQWKRKNDKGSGVVLKKGEKIQPGLTLFTAGRSRAKLIDPDGNVLHTWKKMFSSVWPDAEHIIDKVPDERIYWRNVYLQPNGDLFVIFEGTAMSPYGGGLIKINQNSDLIWDVGINAHHDLDISKDGLIYVLSHKYEQKENRSLIHDYITLIDQNGHIQKKVSLIQAFRNTQFEVLLPDKLKGDVLHTNNVEILSEDIAKSFPWKAGDLLFSFNAIGVIAVVDGTQFKLKWVLPVGKGGVHDADFLPGGNILYLHNRMSDLKGKKGSQIVKYDLSKRENIWTYSNPGTFYTKNRGAQQLLDNGNFLITESTDGTIFEIIQNKKVIWKYVTKNQTDRSIQVVHWAKKYPRSYCQFLSGKPPD